MTQEQGDSKRDEAQRVARQADFDSRQLQASLKRMLKNHEFLANYVEELQTSRQAALNRASVAEEKLGPTLELNEKLEQDLCVANCRAFDAETELKEQKALADHLEAGLQLEFLEIVKAASKELLAQKASSDASDEQELWQLRKGLLDLHHAYQATSVRTLKTLPRLKKAVESLLDGLDPDGAY